MALEYYYYEQNTKTLFINNIFYNDFKLMADMAEYEKIEI
jgi:hypothetical protein